MTIGPRQRSEMCLVVEAEQPMRDWRAAAGCCLLRDGARA